MEDPWALRVARRERGPDREPPPLLLLESLRGEGCLLLLLLCI
jgi:hypothetical protein